jgi:hypothetical protein
VTYRAHGDGGLLRHLPQACSQPLFDALWDAARCARPRCSGCATGWFARVLFASHSMNACGHLSNLSVAALARFRPTTQHDAPAPGYRDGVVAQRHTTASHQPGLACGSCLPGMPASPWEAVKPSPWLQRPQHRTPSDASAWTTAPRVQSRSRCNCPPTSQPAPRCAARVISDCYKAIIVVPCHRLGAAWCHGLCILLQSSLHMHKSLLQSWRAICPRVRVPARDTEPNSLRGAARGGSWQGCQA